MNDIDKVEKNLKYTVFAIAICAVNLFGWMMTSTYTENVYREVKARVVVDTVYVTDTIIGFTADQLFPPLVDSSNVGDEYAFADGNSCYLIRVTGNAKRDTITTYIKK